MNIPGLGEVTKVPRFGWYESQAIALPLLDGKVCRVIIQDYDEDPAKDDFHTAIANLLSSPRSVLAEAEPYVFAYYQDVNSNWDPSDEEHVAMHSPSEVWDHVQLGTEPIVSRRSYGDRGIYVSLECNCDWEPEHGLQIVFRNGNKVCKVGPYDGHLTNADAYADPALEDVVYR
ncbi:hypothetical protein EZJ19_15185 [Parasulfuritortus cantonensis]|uniref:DUF6985 domain-containing protein n=1 Tax=Parasulfuritortus cantonensis TaxID=2528202 RepID=A0A4R1B7B1_9PROT|nr:hypothetical protein [Parasulfuritortus cantonensis]TCJ11613.1 hypothetical protein EZJ19_15185 [Parasulfuritortus cantonensis]